MHEVLYIRERFGPKRREMLCYSSGRRCEVVSSSTQYGCADRTNGSVESVAVPKATHLATQFFHQGRSSGASGRKLVFVMQSAQDRYGHDLMTDPKAMPARFDSQGVQPRMGNARSQRQMWSATVVVGHPRHQDFSQVSFAQRNRWCRSSGGKWLALISSEFSINR